MSDCVCVCVHGHHTPERMRERERERREREREREREERKREMRERLEDCKRVSLISQNISSLSFLCREVKRVRLCACERERERERYSDYHRRERYAENLNRECEGTLCVCVCEFKRICVSVLCPFCLCVVSFKCVRAIAYSRVRRHRGSQH